MYSQSTFAQLTRMTFVLIISLCIIHQSDDLIQLMAQSAIDLGCHQMTDHSDHEMPAHSHKHHAHH